MQNLTVLRARARDQIRHVLRETIVSNEFSGGERLDEIRLAGMLGVSRTPLREALIGLEEEGLVVSRPNRGFAVALLDEKLVRELYPILAALEAAALDLGGSRLLAVVPQLKDINKALRAEKQPARRYALDREFHRALTQPCGNARLLHLLEQHWTHARRIDGGAQRGIANLEGSCIEHDAIIRRIERKDFAGAAQLLRTHWHQGIAVVLRWMQKAP
jgi:DNA-binding GntR family transcriptional regulator